MHMQRTASGVAGNGLYTTINYMRGAAGLGLGTTIKYLRRTTSAAANKSLSTKINPPCSVAVFVVNSEPPSVRLCVGPELFRCVHLPTFALFFFVAGKSVRSTLSLVASATQMWLQRLGAVESSNKHWASCFIFTGAHLLQSFS
jgi:hypothetical protein